MAHFAELNDESVVIRVVVISNDEIEGDEEALGVARCQELFGAETTWKQTSYNGNIRKNYAGPGFTYNADLDAFIAPQPYKSWTLNEETCKWQAPKPQPEYPSFWNEGMLRWDRIG